MAEKPTQGDLFPVSSIAPKLKLVKRRRPNPSVVEERLLKARKAEDEIQQIIYQHTLFCQACMPRTDPGDAVRRWERANGIAVLEIEAGRMMDPQLGRLVDVGLPFGAKPRLVLAHINTEVLRTGKMEIETARSLTAWASRTLKIGEPNGRELRSFRQQLARLAACRIRLGVAKDGHAVTMQSHIVSKFDLWLESFPDQKDLWPQMIQISPEYFASIQKHAVPLDEAALSALAHNTTAIDLYSWLAQRLHRMAPGKKVGIPWPMVASQFGGEGYARLRKFRENFLVTLREVKAVYPQARVEADERGLQLRQSPPPVPPRFLAISAR